MTNVVSFDEYFARHWVGDVHDTRLAALLGNDRRLPHVNEVAVTQALAGFALEPRVPLEWLTVAVRRALAHCMPDPERMPDVRPGPKDARDTFLRLSAQARELADEIDNLPLDVAAPLSQGLDEQSFLELGSWLLAVRKLSDNLEKVASGIEVKRGRRASSEIKALREEWALSLIPVFQDAFGIAATITDPRDGEGRRSWPDFGIGFYAEFFARMVRLATSEILTKDQVRDATKGARARFRLQPFSYSPGIIPPP